MARPWHMMPHQLSNQYRESSHQVTTDTEAELFSTQMSVLS